jgi:hypothetical protein
MEMDWAKVASGLYVGLIGSILVATACLESFIKGQVDPAILTLAAAVVATYFTGNAVRQVNGLKVDALKNSVDGLHARLDTANIGPAKDGTEK